VASAYPHIKVRLVTREPLALFLGKGVASSIRRRLVRLGVEILDQSSVTAVRAQSVVIDQGSELACDLCIWTGGFVAPPLAREAGLAVNEHNQVIVDPFLRSISHPEIYAIGDAASPSEDPGVRVRMSAGTATIMGAHGADCLSATLSGKAPKPLSFAYLGQGIALGRHNAIGFNNYPDDKPFPPYFTGRLGYLIREGSCDCWQLRYSMACLCSQGSDAMSVHNIDNRRGQRKIRCNSIEYDIYYKEGNRNGSNE
jgi:NADH dehydrogenase FAD-containing subunit